MTKPGEMSPDLGAEAMLRYLDGTAVRSRTLPLWARYALAALLALAALGAQLALFGPHTRYPYVPYVPAVLLSAVALDRASGAFAALLSGAGVLGTSIRLGAGWPPVFEDLLGATAFLGVSLLAASAVEALHRARDDLAAANERLRLALREAETRGTLLSESAHRARNDLQMLSGVQQQQAHVAEQRGEPAAAAALRAGAERALALGQVRALVESGTAAAGSGAVDARSLLQGIAEALRAAIVPQHVVFEVAADASAPLRAARARALGLLVNELVTNAAKYAFPDGRPGRIRVSLTRRAGGELALVVEDDGVGIDPAAPPRGTGLGRRLARALAKQLGGGLAVGPGEGGRGTRWEVRSLAA